MGRLSSPRQLPSLVKPHLMRTVAALSASLLILQHAEFSIGPRMKGKSFRTLLCMHDMGIVQEALF